LGGQEPNPTTIQKAYIQPKKGKANPTGLNPVKDQNERQSKTHQTQSSKSNAEPETKLQKKRCVKDSIITTTKRGRLKNQSIS
jgi:hypothetical protein